MNAPVTFVLIIITCLVSIFCFSNRKWFDRLEFNAYQIVRRKQYYRLFSHGFVHANWTHLLINMIVFFSFGQAVENYYLRYAAGGIWTYLALYFLALPMSSLLTLRMHYNNPYYNAVGASGAVNAIVFAFVFLDPWSKLYLFFAIPIPGIVFGILYLWYSYVMSKKENDGIGHDAHFLGAVWGIFFTAICISGSLVHFFNQLTEF